MGINEDDPDEGARDLSEMALSLLDRDTDGRVSLEDFLQSIQNDYLLMEISESCLPSGARAAAIAAAMEVGSSLRVSLLHMCDDCTYTTFRNSTVHSFPNYSATSYFIAVMLLLR